MMKDAKLAMTSLTVQVKRTIFFPVEVDAPIHQTFNTGRSIFYHLLHGSGVADVVAGHHGVVNMLFKVIGFEICHLRLGRIGLIDRGFTYQGHFTFSGTGHLKCIRHAGHS